jgi:phosphoserine aminotransferase
MSRPYNFSAGPAVLPETVLRQAAGELDDWHGSGVSVMEMSHRGRHFTSIAEQAEADFRGLLGVPDDYAVLFLQGGATSQFAMVPLNLMRRGRADYVNTGSWSKKAIAEAQRLGEVNVVATAEADGFTDIPAAETWQRDAEADYLHLTPNETIGGVEFHWVPEDHHGVPLVADMSSCILSRPVDVSRYGLIYAGAQKNIGPAGLTVVVVRRDLLGWTRESTPSMFDYAAHAKAGSMLNTPPTFAWYLSGLVFRWIWDQGGLDAMAARNRNKADKLYRAIDESAYYRNPVAVDCRSRMNVPFVLHDPGMDGRFLAEAEAAGLLNLKGHRSVGGMRASLYNAMPEQGVDALIDFMGDFERRRG